MTPERIIDAARIDLKDNFSVELRRWPDDDMFSYIAHGIEEISNAFPNMTQSTAEIQLTAGVYQEIPADWKKLIRIELNSSGRPVFEVDRGTSNAFYAHIPQMPSNIIIEYWKDIKADRSFYVNPPATASATVIAQGSRRQPFIVDMNQELVLLDEGIAMIVNYVLYMAFRKDTEAAAAREVSEWYFQKWRQDLALKATMDALNTMPAGLMAQAIAQIQGPGVAGG